MKRNRVKVTYADGTQEIRTAGSFQKKGKKRRRKPKFYERYLRTPHFKRLRAAVLARDNWACTACGRRRTEGAILQAHHLTYKRCPYREQLDDLITLCQACHRAEHGYRHRGHDHLDSALEERVLRDA